MVKIYSANGPSIFHFISSNNIYQKLESEQPIQIEKQMALAGPNDNLQIIVNPIELAITLGLLGIAKEVGKELLKLSVKDFYESKKKQFGSMKQYAWKLIDTILWITGIAPNGTTILLGAELQLPNTGFKDRNIGFNMAGLSREEIEKRMFLIAIYGEDIKKFITELVAKSKEGNKDLFFEENEDCSVKIFLQEDLLPYVQYFNSQTTDSSYIQQFTKAVFRKLNVSYHV